MQNLANITSTEIVVVGSAVLVVCVAPSVLAWSDARRRRKALARVAALEAAGREAAVGEAAAREAAVEAPSVPAWGPMDFQQLWDEPTVTVDADVLAAPPALAEDAAVFEVPPEAARVAAVEAPPIVESAAPPPIVEPAAPPTVEVVNEPPAPVETRDFHFCLQDLRRVRLANWPPAEVQEDPVRGEVWREAERLAAHLQREIGAAPLASPHPAQSSCLGSAEAGEAGMRLRFLLFPVIWPSTAEQATAEAVFEIEPGGGAIRGAAVNSLRRPH